MPHAPHPLDKHGKQAFPRPRSVLINPPASRLGTQNAILSGTSARHHVPEFEGCLSIKSIVTGSAMWEAAGRQFIVHENCYLILNDRQHYTLTIESTHKVKTFCAFFRRGLVEDVHRGMVTSSARLLDAHENPSVSRTMFLERIEPGSDAVMAALAGLHKKLVRGKLAEIDAEDNFIALATAMVREHQRADAAIAKLPALRASTRRELYRRTLRGRDYLMSLLDQTPSLADMARAACLSPFHFHRVFTRIFGDTPHRYLTRQRLKKAAAMLVNTQRSVTEICMQSGFESLGSFSSLFRRHLGVSPSELRAAGKISKIKEDQWAARP